MKKSALFLLVVMSLTLAAGIVPIVASAYSFADSAMESLWMRTDKPITEGRVARSWMWGEQLTGGAYETYAESPGGSRLVQYFDKSRMEINNPYGDRGSQWFVTNGLLVWEMVNGKVQLGNSSFESRSPANEAVAGDNADVNPNCPTYASFTYLPASTSSQMGQRVTATLSKDGAVGYDGSKAGYAGTEIARYENGHNIPSVLWNMMNSRGLVYENGRFQTGLIVDWVFAMGYPISEPYWVYCKVGGVDKDVLVQLFERRVLTYTPSNPAGWQVEMGNVGLQYHRWRYSGSTPPAQCTGLSGVTISGPTSGNTGQSLTFTANGQPGDATQPFAYTWSPEPSSGQGTANASYVWQSVGSQTIQVAVSNCSGATTVWGSYQVNISVSCNPLTGLTINGPTAGDVGQTLTFTANGQPADATQPFAYTWSPEPSSGQGTANASYVWQSAGSQTVQVAVSNCSGAATAWGSYTVVISTQPLVVIGPYGGPFGKWAGSFSRCPEGTWAVGMQLRVESAQGAGDDTALNGISLLCADLNNRSDFSEVRSKVGDWGNWYSGGTCAAGYAISGARLRIEGDIAGDDTGADNAEFTCGNGVTLATQWIPNVYGWGEWRSWQSCPTGYAICGLETKVEGRQGMGDDTALNDAKFLCCPLP